ncbi:hypothetical protein BU24DRAFT_203474 [Aaosphaeria arxii CBS 175.79]|uniref:Uncharacterized protein n=1 Tax=Aaosphaeria arxii CBS 175.79 TaxID=1450172 RepID=A0A6A5XTA4_9PLEO|nr:uncharacterized protein BU24DRAFT_203474 [Aaosphaeria arxii CBS 175.79]KAF2016518.1 hypothetical protein BU24DRAFT_203474 [Aaosphaeria arxii CBS 175.79]
MRRYENIRKCTPPTAIPRKVCRVQCRSWHDMTTNKINAPYDECMYVFNLAYLYAVNGRLVLRQPMDRFSPQQGLFTQLQYCCPATDESCHGLSPFPHRLGSSGMGSWCLVLRARRALLLRGRRLNIHSPRITGTDQRHDVYRRESMKGHRQYLVDIVLFHFPHG